VWDLLEEFGFTAPLAVNDPDAVPVKRRAGRRRTGGWSSGRTVG